MSGIVSGDEFNCGICYEICSLAVLTSCCEQLYCGPCVDRLEDRLRCIICRSDCTYKPSLFARRV